MEKEILIRKYSKSDLPKMIDLSLHAFKPVFTSFRKVLGKNIFAYLYPNWRKIQSDGITYSCKKKQNNTILVAEKGERVVGFIIIKRRKKAAEILLLAVHPLFQKQGIGTKLNKAALANMKNEGITFVEVGTGGDEGHAPARKTYKKVGYIPLPLVRYYKKL
jgi:ribosomal protein S18 acetylase RimI-like enzyme